MPRPSVLLCALLAAAPLAPAAAAPGAEANQDLLALSLEELGQVNVTATSRSASRLADTPASVFVIQGEDIRLLGIRSLPEALRLAPNLQVAQVSASSHAVSARGMKTTLSNKLLVMIDGRPIYTPLFAGVLWDMQAVAIEEIDRIEVVSGPGAAAWGANAVNGVINIVTRPAQELAGGYVRAWGGEEGAGFEAGQALRAGPDGAVRLYARRDRRDASSTVDGQAIADAWTQRQAGFRGDWQHGDDGVQVQGDVFRAESAPRLLGPVEASGHNLLARWSRTLDDDRQWSLQAYHDVADRFDPVVLDDRMRTDAVEFTYEAQHAAHRLSWGLGYRQTRDDSRPGAVARLVPDEVTLRWAHAFVQDRIALSERLTADLGLRLDRNSYTGVEVLPTARFSWRQRSGALLWGALSRAVRAPARFDRDFHFPASEPYIIRGGPDFQAEVSNVAELGVRAQPTDWLSLSMTGFHHWYDDLRGGEPAPQGGLYIANTAKARSYGAEGWATLRVPGQWEVAAGFLEMRQRVRPRSGPVDPATARDQGNDPEHQWLLRATRRLGERQQMTAFARYVGALPDPAVPGYVQLDARWSYAPSEAVELGLGVNDLLDRRHAEFGPADGLAQSVFGRAVFADLKVAW